MRFLDRCEVKRKEWSRIDELGRWEETMPRLKESGLENVSRVHKAKTGVGCDGFHPKVPLDLLDTRNKKGNCRVPREGGTEWQMAATSLHDDALLDFERDADCADADFDTSVGSMEGAGSGKMTAEVPNRLGRY